MFITDKLTETAIAICNEFRHWVWVPLDPLDPLGVASSKLSRVCCFISYFCIFFFFVFGWRRLDRVDLHYKCTRVDRQLCAKITTVPRGTASDRYDQGQGTKSEEESASRFWHFCFFIYI